MNTPEENKPTHEVVKIEPFQQKVDAMKELVKDYKNLVVTKENLKEMDEKRLVLYRHRIDIQRQEKSNNDSLNKAKKLNTARAAELIGIIEPVETDLQSKIRTIQDEEAAAKKKEQERIAKHQAVINAFGTRLLEVVRIKNIQDLEKKKSECQNWLLTYKGEEYHEQIVSAAKAYMDAIDNLILAEKSKLPAESVPEQQKTLFDIHMAEELKNPSNISAEDRVLAKTGLSRENPNGVAKEPEKVVLKPEVESKPDPTFEERAKSGEFSVGVACNLVVSGYRFYVDTKLSEENQSKIRAFLTELIDGIMENEEAF